MLDGLRRHDDPGVALINPPYGIDTAPLRTDRLAIALADQQVPRRSLAPDRAMRNVCRWFWSAIASAVGIAVIGYELTEMLSWTP